MQGSQFSVLILIIICLLVFMATRNKRGKKDEESNDSGNRDIHFEFGDELTEEEFEYIAEKQARRIKRLVDISVRGSIVFGTVRSTTKKTEWGFCIDFNDNGRLTGEYTIYSDNDDSIIPYSVANNISAEIKAIIAGTSVPDIMREQF